MQHYAVIGYPLGYSLSPLMHNAFFRKESLDAEYASVALKEHELSPFLESKKYSGFNVTIPYKEKIMPLLGSLTESAKVIGAVNTVHWTGDHYLGTNTDSPGFTLMLREELNLKMKGLHILLLGAGGAAKAITYAALAEGVDTLAIYDTFPGKTDELLTQYSAWGNHLVPITDKATLRDRLAVIDLVINATPVGMEKSIDESILSFDELQLLRPSSTVVDIIYAPLETKLLRDAKALRLTTLNGIGMLAAQGVLAEEFWFGKRLSYQDAKAILIDGLA